MRNIGTNKVRCIVCCSVLSTEVNSKLGNGDRKCGGGFAISVRVAREGCDENLLFEQRPDGR